MTYISKVTLHIRGWGVMCWNSIQIFTKQIVMWSSLCSVLLVIQRAEKELEFFCALNELRVPHEIIAHKEKETEIMKLHFRI